MIQDIQLGSSTHVVNSSVSNKGKSAGAAMGVRTRLIRKSKPNSKANLPNLEVCDQVALLNIFGATASSHQTITEKKDTVFNQISGLINSDAWFWCRVSDSNVVEGSECTNYDGGGSLAQYVQSMLHSNILQMFLAQEVGNQRTMIINDGGPFSCIYSIRMMKDGTTSLFVSFRTMANEAFAERDSLLLNATLDYLPLAHEYIHDAKKLSLTPKMQLVLKSLKEGHSRKQIADQLMISVNTVSAYVRDIYREYDVHSHAELIRYFHDLD
ncbi:helix-turn-helix transcriptional regulator [Rubritalea sp.]|uniref:helix-turn-helix transcriptional regulator n=1 Tax=Rubritalea sp. TaxID=2109375 RepID=UPI003EF9896D